MSGRMKNRNRSDYRMVDGIVFDSGGLFSAVELTTARCGQRSSGD